MKKYLYLLAFCVGCTATSDTPQPGEDAFSLSVEEICELVFDATATFDSDQFYGTWLLQKTVRCFNDTITLAYDISSDEFEHHHEFSSAGTWTVHTFRQGNTDTLGVLDGVFFDVNAFPKFNYDIFDPGQSGTYPETGEILRQSGSDALFLLQPCAQPDFCGEFQVFLFERMN